MIRKTSILLIFVTLSSVVKCNNAALDWWQTTVIYQIYPKSFLDTDGSGQGDLKGITQQAGYFKDTGIGAVWLSPIFESPQRDFGYDIKNFTKVDPIFGTNDDLKYLIRKYHSLGIKVMMDFVPNHTSDEHIWFKKSKKRIEPYTDYYVWKDPKGWVNGTPTVPNNWMSLVAGTAWQYCQEREQFFLAQFFPGQPELNFHNKKVVEELKAVLRFYLDMGVDGFRTDSAAFLVEDPRYLDQPPINATLEAEKGVDYENQQHIYTLNQPKTYEVMSEFRAVLDSYTKKGGSTRVLASEVYTDLYHSMKYYGTKEIPISHIPFTLCLIKDVNDFSDASQFKKTVDLWLNSIPEGGWPNWQVSNHDNPRAATRFEPAAVDAMNMLVHLLPGTVISFQGDEIGMEDGKLRPDQILDGIVPSRDPARQPYQWDSSLNAGFSSSKQGTWLPVNPNYYSLNLANQKGNSKSHYNVYKNLVRLRSTPVIQNGDYNSCVASKWVFSFKRRLGMQAYVIILNLNNNQEYVNLNACQWRLPKMLRVRIASVNSQHNVGSLINISSGFPMNPKSALTLAVF